MKIISAMRIKNEERWIRRSIESQLPLVEQVFIFDDHSTDQTAEICRAFPEVTLYESPFQGLDEAKDKNWLLDRVAECQPTWILFIDGDEILAPGSQTQLLTEMQNPHAACLSLRILYLWNDEQTVRMDGVYGDFHRESVFRPNGSRYVSNGRGGFHCGNVPMGNRSGRRVLDVPLLHVGYMHREDRERKYVWYNANDPNNSTEDQYRHILIGDRFPADSRFHHGGPLVLAPL